MSEVKEKKNQPVQQEGDFKIKKKPKKLNSTKENTTKVDFKKQEEEALEDKNQKTQDAISKSETRIVDEEKPTTPVEKVEEEVRELPKSEDVKEKVDKEDKKEEEKEVKTEENKTEEEVTIIEEVVKEEEETTQVVEKIKEEIKENPQLDLPENVEKLVDFMKETGGTLEDYVSLNKDYSNLNNEDLLVQYYLQTKPHLDAEEINFLLDDQFAWDEDVDEERSIKKKKLALKEEVAKAQNFLESSKEKYYKEIKLRPGTTQEQQKAMDFFNRYNTEQEARKQNHEKFKNITNKFFSDEFKGFDFKVGEKQFKYKVNNTSDIANSQSDLNNFIGKFLDKNGQINDLEGYHKAIYSAKNADTIAKHFYEQGKTDAIKDVTAKSKNIVDDVRPSNTGDLYIGGLKVKAVSGVDSSKLKIKTIKK